MLCGLGGLVVKRASGFPRKGKALGSVQRKQQEAQPVRSRRVTTVGRVLRGLMRTCLAVLQGLTVLIRGIDAGIN